MAELTTRYIGYCPICMRDIKLQKDRLVHHGYQRPGDGMIHGDCFAVSYAPYELSKQACVAWRSMMRDRLASATKRIAELGDPKLMVLSGSLNACFYGPLRESDARGRHWREAVALYYQNTRFFEVRRNGPGDEPLIFSNWHHEYISTAEHNERVAKSEIARMDQLIEKWSPKPVRTVEEAKQEKSADRAAIVQAKRDAREAKRRELDERKARWEAERQALIKKYRKVFVGVYESLPSEEDRAASMELLFDWRRKQRSATDDWSGMRRESSRRVYLNFDPRDLEIDHALLALNLAWKDDRDFIHYANDEGQLDIF